MEPDELRDLHKSADHFRAKYPKANALDTCARCGDDIRGHSNSRKLDHLFLSLETYQRMTQAAEAQAQG